jgi:hypothetical protein
MNLLLLAAPTLAATLRVGPTQTYTTIGAAVSAAAAGDTIEVQPGRYAEALDLRGKSVTVRSAAGPRVTTIASSYTHQLDGGTLQGFRLEPAPTAILIASGSPTLRELEIIGPASYGVDVTGGSPTIEEVLVANAGVHAFILRAGTPTVRRSIAWNPAQNGFVVRTGGVLQNVLAVGADYGFVAETASSTWTNAVALGASLGGVASSYASTFTNGVYQDNDAVVRCFGATSSFPNGLMWSDTDAVGCSGSPLAALAIADAGFTAWSTGTDLYAVDLRPGVGSPMVNGGSGLDPDGSPADLGLFGGSSGTWTDADGDGVVVLFDCDDHDRKTAPGAAERADALDNDCDDVVDEDVPVDTGGGDTADTGEDTGDIADDSGTPVAPTDLDGDGFAADVDCGEHNVATYPGARERSDGVDNDCDGRVDDGTLTGDDDGDGYAEVAGDCDDTDPLRNPGANDTSGAADGVDDDCDGLSDNPVGRDADGDGFRDDVDDCDDTDAAVRPGVFDGADGVDSDCDGVTDDDAYNADSDGDGQTPAQGDCDDLDPLVYLGAVDAPDDFVDQDCTGEDNYDVDRDGDPSLTSGGADCDDGNGRVASTLPESCGDGVDNDCDASADEDCEAPATPDASSGCGCAAARRGATAWALGLAVLAGMRRRRDPSAA